MPINSIRDNKNNRRNRNVKKQQNMTTLFKKIISDISKFRKLNEDPFLKREASL